MATTYTTNYNLGKQENHADKFDMDVITDNADKIDAALTAKADKSTTYTKTEVDTALSGKQATLTTAQLDAVNSGITSADVTQIGVNENNISLITPFDTSPTQNSAKGMTSGALFEEFSKTLRKQSTLSASGDFNSATSNGMYKFNGGPANNPAESSGAYGILLVITFDNYTMQLCYDFLNGVYYRNKVSSWSAWTKFN